MHSEGTQTFKSLREHSGTRRVLGHLSTHFQKAINKSCQFNWLSPKHLYDYLTFCKNPVKLSETVTLCGIFDEIFQQKIELKLAQKNKFLFTNMAKKHSFNPFLTNVPI